jgi:hypothetical protein
MILKPIEFFVETYIEYVNALQSLTNDYKWDPDKNIAKCSQNKPHQVPDIKCTCGFYAVYNLIDVPIGSTGILAVIEGSGKVILGTRGFRCQYAKVVALSTMTLTPSQELEALAKEYGVEYFPLYRDLIDIYPPTDVSELIEKEEPVPYIYMQPNGLAYVGTYPNGSFVWTTATTSTTIPAGSMVTWTWNWTE